MRFPRRIPLVAVLVAAAGLGQGACNSESLLPEAGYLNVVDTVTLYALRGTEVTLPSGYDVANRTTSRTDVATFDFAFDINTAGQGVALPAGALRLAREPGSAPVTTPFDSIIEAPESGYLDSLPVPIAPGTVFVVRSRFLLAGCEFAGAVPRYGKFRVMEIDPALRRLKLQALVNRNCGYRGLQPGNPPN